MSSLAKRPLVIYHANCWDGFCAAWVARMALGQIDAIPAHYGTPPPQIAGRDVYIVDFSYPRQVLQELVHSAAHVVVLDHHKTAEAELIGLDEELAPDLVVRFASDKSGGRLAWEYFAPIGGWLGQDSPWLVNYTEDRDLWRHQLPDSEAVNAALRSYPLDFELWDDFAQFHPAEYAKEGQAIRRRERQIVQDHLRHARHETFDGTWTVPIVNATVLFSEIAGELAKGEPFAACYFDRQDGKRQWSLRSDEQGVDVSDIAKAHGGGGHARAAGFEETL